MGVDSVNILKKIENGYHPNEVNKLIEPILHEGKSDGPLKNGFKKYVVSIIQKNFYASPSPR